MGQILTATPGHPAYEVIEHSDGDYYQDEITGYNKDDTPFDFTGMTFHLQIGRYDKFDPEEKLFEIPNTAFTITQNAEGVAAGVNNVLQIGIEDPFFAKNGQYWHYVRLFDAAGKQFTYRKGPFIIDN